MLEDRSAATPDGRSAGATNLTLLSRIQEGLAGTGSATGARRCPCCGRPLRAGQRITTIYGTSVHVTCATKRH